MDDIFMKNKLNEECGVFGVYNHDKAVEFTYYGLHALQHRGQEGAGIVSSNTEKLIIKKGEGLVRDVFTNADLEKIHGVHTVGHVRYSTAGGGGLANVQPFLFNTHLGQLGLAHNGNLVNTIQLKCELEREGSIFQTTSDTEVLAHLIFRNKSKKFIDRIKQSLQKLEGAFAFVMLVEDTLYAALDDKGLRPLSIGRIGDAYVVSSETCAFDVVGAEFIRDMVPGEVVRINQDGILSSFYSKNRSHNICSMEYVYFARPDSDIEGINVHAARKRTGKKLAIESPVEADVVIGVPDSGISAAVGYSEQSGIPFEMGLIKNKYSGRTFIEPSQELREIGVKMKLSAVRSLVKDKSVILVDDSIVRGTTAMKLVEMVRNAGAKEVHFRVSSPELKNPCFYGVDFPTHEELISSFTSVQEVADEIGVDSLAFITLKGLQDSIGRDVTKGAYCGQCVACFNGDYPTNLYK
jgi:amidophosphoribosyltransferase